MIPFIIYISAVSIAVSLPTTTTSPSLRSLHSLLDGNVEWDLHFPPTSSIDELVLHSLEMRLPILLFENHNNTDIEEELEKSYIKE